MKEKTMKHVLIATLIAVSSALPAASFAAGDHGSHQMAQAPAAAEAQMVDGLVKKIDKSAGKVTLSHGPLTNLGMPAMTMVFRVKDAGWLGQMKEGDKIRFMADKVNGVFTVVHFEAAN
jgi:Cu/Ag efflux protein CusF